MKTATITILTLVASTACGPSDEPSVERVIELEPTPSLPSGEASLAGGVVEVRAAGLEELVDAVHVAWVEDGSGDVHRVGPLENGSVDATVADAEDGWHCFVTEEDSADADRPSARHRLDGELGGPLGFEPHYDRGHLETAGGDCTLADFDVEMQVEGLPEAPDGLEYTAWAVCPHLEGHRHSLVPDDDGRHDTMAGEDGHHRDDDDGDEHDDEEDGHHHHWGDDGETEAAEEATRLGALERDLLHMRHHDRVGGCESVFLTLESHHGVEGPSPIVVMHGDVSFPERSEEPEGHIH